MDESKVQELVNKAVADALAKRDTAPASTPAPTASDLPPVAPLFVRKQADPLDSPLVKAIIAGDEAKVCELAVVPGTKSETMPLGVLDETAIMEATDVATRYEISRSGANASRLLKWGQDYGNGIAALPGRPDLNHLQTMLSAGQPISGDIQKSLTAAMNFVGINLERPARLMLPYIAALRRRLAADNMATGATQVQWRVQLGFGGWDFSAFGTPLSPVAGNTGTDLAGNAQTFAADYRTQALHGEVQFEAIPFAQGFDDPVQIETARGLATLLRIEELLCLGANEVAIAAPGSLTVAQSSLNVAHTFATGVWTVSVLALTLAGTQNTNTVPGTTNNPANQIVGASAPVTNAFTVAANPCDFLDVYWPAVQGAVGYLVYCDAAVAGGAAERLVPLANMKYGKITAGAFDLSALGDQIVALNPNQPYVGVNHVQIFAPPLLGSTSVIPTGGDLTVNALTFEGLISWCSKNIILGQNLNTLTGYTKIAIDQGGAPLTTISAGIKEFDTILQNLMVQWHVGATLIVCSPQSLAAVSSRLLAANGGFVYRVDISQERNSFVGGLYAGGYPNKFVTNMVTGQPAVIPIWAHPYMPDGTFLFINERIPYAYSREARGFALDIATPYTYFELGRTNRSFPFSLFFIETMKCYHPFAQAIIQGARVDA